MILQIPLPFQYHLYKDKFDGKEMFEMRLNVPRSINKQAQKQTIEILRYNKMRPYLQATPISPCVTCFGPPSSPWLEIDPNCSYSTGGSCTVSPPANAPPARKVTVPVAPRAVPSVPRAASAKRHWTIAVAVPDVEESLFQM